MHWTATQTYLNTAHSHYYISLSLSLSVPSPVLLTWPPFASCHDFCCYFLFIAHLRIFCITPSPPNNVLMAFISLTISVNLIHGAQGRDASMPENLSLFVAPGKLMLELRKGAQEGWCQCRTLVCRQGAMMHLLTEYWMNVCTCIKHVQSSIFSVFCIPCVLYWNI